MAKAAAAPVRAEDFLPLKHREFLMLLVLAQRQSHGYALKQELLTRTDGRLDLGPGTLYRTVRTLEQAKLIVESAARPDDDDPRRRYYDITEFGREVASAEARRLAALVAEARSEQLLP